MSKQAKAIEEARKRWGTAEVLTSNPNPQPAPEAPAAAEGRRAA